MKTIREWFETFPEPYRTQALENLKKADGTIKERSAKDALLSGFHWPESSQGDEYWRKFITTLN